MKLVIWHGYLLSGTGSNIYTQHVARAWGRLGHDVRVLCQEPHPDAFDLGANVRLLRPPIGPLLPTFVVDRYEGVEARHVAEMSDRELDRYLELNVAALAEELRREPAAMVLANHAIMGGPVAQAACGAATPYAINLDVKVLLAIGALGGLLGGLVVWAGGMVAGESGSQALSGAVAGAIVAVLATTLAIGGPLLLAYRSSPAEALRGE